MLAALFRQPWRIASSGAGLARLHVSIHRKGAGPDSGLPCLSDMLKRRIQAAPLLSEPEKAAAIAALGKLPAGRQLLHGDFHPGNVLLSGGKPWVIDWMTAVYGHPAADAARTLLLLRMAALPAELSRLSGLVLDAIRSMLLRQYRRAYLRLSGLEARELEAWMLPLAAARLCEELPRRRSCSCASSCRASCGGSIRSSPPPPMISRCRKGYNEPKPFAERRTKRTWRE